MHTQQYGGNIHIYIHTYICVVISKSTEALTSKAIQHKVHMYKNIYTSVLYLLIILFLNIFKIYIVYYTFSIIFQASSTNDHIFSLNLVL